MEDISLYWFIAAAVFFIAEIFIPGFIMASIGLGCLFSFGAASLGMGLAFQFVFFSMGVLLGFMGIKPLLKRFSAENNVKTNYEGYVGRMAKVIEKIDPESDTGCISLDGDQWKAISLNNETIEAGKRVEIVKQDSIIFTVKPLDAPQKEESVSISAASSDVVLFIGGKESIHQTEDLAFFYSSQKNSFAVLKDGKEIILDESLDKIEERVAHTHFFRANRQFLVSARVIEDYEKNSDGKIMVTLSEYNAVPNVISVSRLKARSFIDWAQVHIQR